jgi:microcystin-dependent protein
MPLNTTRLGLPYPTPTETPDVPRDIQALAQALDSLVYILGELRAFALSAPPAKWLASGALVNQTDYPELFAAVGGTWNIGGETGAQFRAGPVIAGRALIGAGAGPGLTNRPIATRVGEETHKLLAAESGVNGSGSVVAAPNHTHLGSVDNPTYGLAAGGGSFQYNLAAGTDPIPASYVNPVTSPAGAHGHNLTARDADANHNVMQPSVAVLVAIYAGR